MLQLSLHSSSFLALSFCCYDAVALASMSFESSSWNRAHFLTWLIVMQLLLLLLIVKMTMFWWSVSEHHSAAPPLPTEGSKDLHFYFCFCQGADEFVCVSSHNILGRSWCVRAYTRLLTSPVGQSSLGSPPEALQPSSPSVRPFSESLASSDSMVRVRLRLRSLDWRENKVGQNVVANFGEVFAEQS